MLNVTFLYILGFFVYLIFLLVNKKVKFLKIMIYSIFYFYIISVIGITIFPLPIAGIKEFRKFQILENNFIPFYSIYQILNSDLLFITKIKNILGNVILFIPMGFFVTFIWKNNFKISFIIAIFASILIESLQYFISFLLKYNYRVTDIDDVFLNVLGFIMGFYLYKLFKLNYEFNN